MGFLSFDEIPGIKKGLLRASTIDITPTGEHSCSLLMYNDEPDMGEFSIVVVLSPSNAAKALFVDQKLEAFASNRRGRQVPMAYAPSGYVFKVDDTPSEDYSVVNMGLTSRYGELTRAIIINNKIYLLGMSRQMYSYDDKQGWVCLHEEVLDRSIERLTFSGFLAADGGVEGILVGGIGGEVWRYVDAAWEKLDSPYNTDIHDILFVEDGHYLLGGQLGIFGCYVDGRWYDYSDELSMGDIEVVVRHAGGLAVLSAGRVFRLTLDGYKHIGAIEQIGGEQGKIRALAEASRGLWALTQRDILRIGEDGVVETIGLGEILEGLGIELS
jgi:hypothetical protein